MKTVNFIQMADGTPEDYAILGQWEEQFLKTFPQNLINAVKALQNNQAGFQITRFEHSLQSATRAHRDGRDKEYVVACLLHDIGDLLAPFTHGEMVAAVMKPYMSEKMCWILKNHGLFQTYYYAHYIGADRNARDVYKDHPWYDDCVEFCQKYDQNCIFV